MADYEIVNDNAVLDIGDMLPVCKVKTAGEMIADFAEKKEALQNYMNARYGELVVNESTITAIKKDLAELRKVEKEIGAIIKSAKAEFNKPIELTIAQAEEFKKVVTDTINNLATKQREVDERMQAEYLEGAKTLYSLILGGYEQEVQTFAKECESWIVKDQWKNKTYTDAQVKNDSKQALDSIKFALQVFQGKYRAQALAKFKQTGNLTMAQDFVKQMEEADRKEAEFQAVKNKNNNEVVESTVAVPQEPVETIAQGPTEGATSGYIQAIESSPYKSDVIEVSTPESYFHSEADYDVKVLNLSITGPVAVHNWIKDLLVLAPETDFKVITQEMVLSAAEKIMQRRNKKQEENK